MEDAQAIEEFMLIQEQLFRFSKSIVDVSEEAEDAVQDTFVRLIKTVRKKPIDNIEAWCMTVVRNRSFDILRKRKKNQTITQDLKVNPENTKTYIPETTLQEERWQLVLACLKEIPEKYRMVIELRDIEGMSYQDIADHCGLSLSQVKVALHRGRQHLKKKVLERVPRHG